MVCLDQSGNHKLSQSGKKKQTFFLSFKEIVNTFLSRYAMSSFVSPPLRLLTLWFFYSTLSFLMAMLLAKIISLILKRSHLLFFFLALIFSFFGTFVFSLWTGEFIFILPSAVFLAILPALTSNSSTKRTDEHTSQLLPRLFLAGFIATCLLYYYICDMFFIVSGIAFLAGFIPAMPILLIFAAHLGKPGKSFFVSLFLFFSAYVLFFWSSTLLLLLKNNGFF